MPLQLLPATEEDMSDFTRIQTEAFDEGITQFLTTSRSPEAHEKAVQRHLKSYREEKDCHYMKVVDTDLNNKMIAGAKWRINEAERTEEEIQSMLPSAGLEHEENQAAKDFKEYLVEVRKKWMGTKPFCFLHILVTDPAQQRRGAGGMLVRWGTQKADEFKLPAFLESSEAGHALYIACGFNDVQVRTFDLTKYGKQGTARNAAMIREQRTAT